MPREISWPAAGDVEPVTILVIVAIAYTVYHYLPASRGWTAVAQRVFGAIVLGAVPLAISVFAFDRSAAENGLALVHAGQTAVAGAVIFLLAAPAMIAASKNPKMRELYPQMKRAVWDRRGLAENAASWAIYLFGYELFFRGVFLFAMERAFGAWPALAITTVAYVFVHLPKNAGECAGTIPMGFVFGGVALFTGSMWAPFLAHFLIAVGTDLLMIRGARGTFAPASAP